MNFHDAINAVTADLTPQPWDYTADDGTTLTVIPAGLREDPGCAEVMIRITRPDATSFAEYGIITDRTQGSTEIGITTTDLPRLISALGDSQPWQHQPETGELITVRSATDGVTVDITGGWGTPLTLTLPPEQRLPLASALRRALDVARGWEDDA